MTERFNPNRFHPGDESADSSGCIFGLMVLLLLVWLLSGGVA